MQDIDWEDVMNQEELFILLLYLFVGSAFAYMWRWMISTADHLVSQPHDGGSEPTQTDETFRA